jgi:hypothetical protein
LIERYRAHKEGIEEKTRGGFSWREAGVEGRGGEQNGSLIHFQETGFVHYAKILEMVN